MKQNTFRQAPCDSLRVSLLLSKLSYYVPFCPGYIKACCSLLFSCCCGLTAFLFCLFVTCVFFLFWWFMFIEVRLKNQSICICAGADRFMMKPKSGGVIQTIASRSHSHSTRV